MKFSRKYGHLSAIYFYCFTHFVEQFLADFLLLFLLCRRNMLAKGILPRFLARAHNCVDTERLFSLERAFRAICIYCELFCDDPALFRSRQRESRARTLLRALRRTRPLRGGCLCFAKMRRTFLLSKLKSAIAHHLLQKGVPHVVVGGTAF